MQPAELSAVELVAAVRQGDLSASQCTAAFLDRIARLDDTLNAFLHVDREGALAAAAAIDARRKAGQPLGRLAGLPVAVKDALCTRDLPTTCASKMLAGFRPPYDADTVSRLRAADAVIVGKTNMDEFAMGGSNENSAFGPVKNPWDLSRAPGGSSGGSAACVAADMAPVAIGSDTGGSIRQPAGLCGITGLKPTYGRVSRRGLVAFASSLDQIGPMARSAADCALVLEAIAGHDPLDSTSLAAEVPRYTELLEQPLTGLRIGRVRDHYAEGLDPEVRKGVDEAFAVFEAAGATVHDVELIGGPVSATPAFKLGEKTGDPLAMYLVDLYTVATNLAGVGGISFPCGFTKGGLPVGFQLQAPALAEPLLLRAADRFQRLTDWHLRRPKQIA
ncbi:MAG: Asp-tRNA(Asn)/Glu-tRNA(Gln) amidotransferase subunit GatA [Planctomycetia bacterium]|nr:Asp-tRNA(Asn)/Glu-tRNA(Gln) amidotransferase subunit GatA [Planctomycetia bacterium]